MTDHPQDTARPDQSSDITPKPSKAAVTWWFPIWFAAVVVLTFATHEAAHWLAGTALGYDMAMSLNKAWPISGEYTAQWHVTAVAAAGPLFTIAQALIAALLIRRARAPWLWPILLSATAMRALAAGISLFNPNDEARVSADLGLPTFVLPAIVTLGLVALTIWTARGTRWGWRFHLVSLVVLQAAITGVVLGDQIL